MHVLIAFSISVVACPVVRRIGLAAGLVDKPSPGELKIHSEPVPYVGGVAVVGGTLGALAILGWTLPGAIVGAIGGSLGVGLADDVRPLPAWARVILLAGAGALAAWALPLEPLGAFGGAGTAVLVLASANGANILDGQDGLVGGLVALAAFGLAGVTAGAGGSAGPSLALAGAALGFLAWNRPPARIFLGNGGAYAVGAILGALAATAAALDGVRGLLAAGACLGMFAFEIVFTVMRRLLVRGSLATGDRLHSYDLVTTRVGRTRSTVSFWGLGSLCAALGLVAEALPLGWTIVLAAVVALASAFGGIRLWSARPAEVRQPP